MTSYHHEVLIGIWCALDLFLSTGVMLLISVDTRVDAGWKTSCVDFALFTKISQGLFCCVVQRFVFSFVQTLRLARATLLRQVLVKPIRRL